MNVIENIKSANIDITKEKQTLLEILSLVEGSQKRALKRGLEPRKIEYAYKIDQDMPLDPTSISQIVYLPFKYIGKNLEVYIRRGLLNNSTKVCIKYFLFSSPELIGIFDKEKKLTKYLSEKHPCYLKYYGWFIDKWQIDNQIQNVYAILTENFKITLIEDIMLHSKHKEKYTHNYFFKIVKDLLGAFHYLEQLNIPHFYIRPHNILVTSKHNLKIIGFYNLGMNLVSIPSDANNKSKTYWEDWYYAPELENSQGFDKNDIYLFKML
ncbi:unnamed protein product [Blepharisma stoltei]|uniref:Protein kinase domain-containing protein n=1 Tax=Blepharisma stoltei TaxID=1481888 RepID=A0AAU9JZ13_9CILI|nr:unnamed protein product [Blepharisma stoltei]